jgi:LCP family protein required for cell wall assembly
VLVVLAVLLVAYPAALLVVGLRAVERVGPLPASAVPNTRGHTVLLVGSDSREGTELEAVEGQRTDTIILLHRPAGRAPTVLLSVPRDSHVEIPGHGENKINAAFALGGPSVLTQTVEQATGLHVDSFVETNLGGFASIVEAVGGVQICPSEAINDPLAGLDVQPGCQQMDGTTALAYARTRATATGDLGRVQRQRELIAAIAHEAASPVTLVNPFQAFPLASSAGSAIAADDDTGVFDLARFALGMRAVAGGGAVTLTVPIADATRRTDAGIVVDWDTERAEQVFEAIRTNDTESIRPIAEEQAAVLGG